MHAPEYASTKACRQYRPGLGRFIDLERISNRKNYSRWHEISAKRQHRKSLNVTMEGRSRKGYPISRVSGRWGGGRAKRARLQDEWALTFWVFLHSFYLIVLRGSSYHGICELQVKILVMKRNAYAYYLSHIWFGISPPLTNMALIVGSPFAGPVTFPCVLSTMAITNSPSTKLLAGCFWCCIQSFLLHVCLDVTFRPFPVS